MPTITYENLPQIKKDAIINAAIDEFAEHRFSDASINRIVKSAGISRGSFYQYFADKEDIYLLIAKKIGKEKLEIFAKHPAPSENATFFDVAIAAVPAVLEWVERCPKYNQIGMLMAHDDSAFIQKTVRQMTESQKSVKGYLEKDKEKGLIRDDIDLDLVMEIVIPIITSQIQAYYQEGGQEMAMEKVKQAFDIIARGIIK